MQKLQAAQLAGEITGSEYREIVFVCADCRCDILSKGHYVVLTDRVWRQAKPVSPAGMLCLDCIIDRLGRRLVPSDFADVTINQINKGVIEAYTSNKNQLDKETVMNEDIRDRKKLRKKLRKKGLLQNHNALNGGTDVYCTTQASVDGRPGERVTGYRSMVTIGGPCPSTDTYANVSWHKRRVRPVRPIRVEEQIHIRPFRRGERPTIVVSSGEMIETVDC